MVIIISFVLCCWKYTRRRKSWRRPVHDVTTQSNPAYQAIEPNPYDDIKAKFPTSVKPEPTDKIPEPETSAHQNNASIPVCHSLSTQSKDSTTSAEERGAPGYESAMPNTASAEVTENTETRAVEQNDANMPENGTLTDSSLTQRNDSRATSGSEVGESGELIGATPKTDSESQEKQNSETDSMGEGYASSPKKRPHSGRRLSLPRGRSRTSSTSSYRKGSGPDPEEESLIENGETA